MPVLCVQKKMSPQNVMHWQQQTCPILNKINHAVAQKYSSYCRQISANSIIQLNIFSIFTTCCHRFQLLTWLAYYARRMYITHDVILLINMPKRQLQCFQLRHPTSPVHSTGHRTARTSIRFTMWSAAFCKSKSTVAESWRRPSERTTDCRMAPIWPEHHWPVAGVTAWACQREWRTYTLSINFKWSDY